MEIQAIKNYMKEHKITYDELAQRTGLSKSCITKIFGGYAKYPRVDTMQAIERALGLAPAFTEEEKALGVGQAKTTLSEEEWAWLEQMEELKQKKGDVAVKVIMDMIRAYIEK